MSARLRPQLLLSRREPPPRIDVPNADRGQIRVDLRSSVLLHRSQRLPDHVLFFHLAKAAGTSLRELVALLATERGFAMQAAYDGPLGALPPFNQSRPARIIFGHRVELNFHRLLPPRSTFGYMVAVREPVNWVLSMYMHYYQHSMDVQSSGLGLGLRRFLNASLMECPALLRLPPPEARRGRASACQGQLRYWHPFGDGATTMSRDYGCESVVQRWQSSRVLFLVMERYDESVSLLARVFGRSVATLPEASLRAQRNARSRSAYSDGRISLGDVAAIGAAVATTSCLQHIYVAAHDQFERDLALVAGHHTANSRKTSMKTTQASRSWWGR